MTRSSKEAMRVVGDMVTGSLFHNYEGCSKSKVPYFLTFFLRQHWTKLLREECSGGLYDHTLKIWKLNVCFSSCVSEVARSWSAKFEMYVVIHFAHAEGQPALEFYRTGHWKFKIKCFPLLWVWIGLKCIFNLWDTLEKDFKGKKTEKSLGIPLNWSGKIQNGVPSPLSMNWVERHF